MRPIGRESASFGVTAMRFLADLRRDISLGIRLLAIGDSRRSQSPRSA
jgi:hypothetical protein